jgi:hypothetical protein
MQVMEFVTAGTVSLIQTVQEHLQLLKDVMLFTGLLMFQSTPLPKTTKSILMLQML